MDRNLLKGAVAFLLVYVSLYLVSFLASPAGVAKWLPGKGPLDFSPFDISRLDYALWLLPIVGFFLVYLMVPFIRKEFGFGQFFHYAFPGIFFIASYLAFAVAVFYYFQNQAFLSGYSLLMEFTMQPFPDLAVVMAVPYSNPPQVVSRASINSLFTASSFLYFVLAGLGGWGARTLIESLGEKPEAARAGE